MKMDEYRYTESGLDNVIIEGAHVLVDDAGEPCVTIPNVNGLHKAIAQGIVHRHSAMIGRELRFLRTEMGMTQAELAALVHREPLAISRWERGEIEIDSNAETLIRLHAIERLSLSTVPVAEVAGWCIPTAQTLPLVIDGSDPDNYQPKLAA
jgi:DNA-binding transcriptional regulator YiaG